MALLAAGKEINSKVMGTTVTLPSAQLTYKTTIMIRVSGEKYGASTETSSTPCNVSKTDRKAEVVVVYLLTSL